VLKIFWGAPKKAPNFFPPAYSLKNHHADHFCPLTISPKIIFNQLTIATLGGMVNCMVIFAAEYMAW
jgi:hypothetical protein